MLGIGGRLLGGVWPVGGQHVLDALLPDHAYFRAEHFGECCLGGLYRAGLKI